MICITTLSRRFCVRMYVRICEGISSDDLLIDVYNFFYPFSPTGNERNGFAEINQETLRQQKHWTACNIFISVERARVCVCVSVYKLYEFRQIQKNVTVPKSHISRHSRDFGYIFFSSRDENKYTYLYICLLLFLDDSMENIFRLSIFFLIGRYQ